MAAWNRRARARRSRPRARSGSRTTSQRADPRTYCGEAARINTLGCHRRHLDEPSTSMPNRRVGSDGSVPPASPDHTCSDDRRRYQMSAETRDAFEGCGRRGVAAAPKMVSRNEGIRIPIARGAKTKQTLVLRRSADRARSEEQRARSMRVHSGRRDTTSPREARRRAT